MGATLVEIDFRPFVEVARLLYEGPWVAERYAAIKIFWPHMRTTLVSGGAAND